MHTKYNAIVKIENINIKILHSLYKCEDVPKEDRIKLKNIKNAVKKNDLEVTYCHSDDKKENKLGRMYARGSSIQKLSRKTRNHLCHENYWDLDIVNSHPTILLHICKINNWKCEQLEYYVKNRDLILKQISKFYFGVYDEENKNKSKELMLRLMYGGYEFTWRKENIDDIKDFNRILRFVKDFEKEIKDICDKGWEKYNEYKQITLDILDKKRESHKKKKTSLLSHVLSTEENIK